MKIAIVHPRLDKPGGAERLILWLADGLKRRGLHATLFTERFDRRLTDDRIEVGVLRRGLLNRLLVSKIIDRILYGRQLSRLVKGFSTVIAFNFPSYWWLAEAKRLSINVPRVVWFCNEPLRRLYRDKADRFLMQYCRSAQAHCVGNGVPDRSRQLAEDAWGQNLHLKEEVRMRLIEDRRNLARQRRDREIDKRSVAAMDKVLTISDYTAQSIRSIFGLEAGVCYPGIPLPTGGPGAAPPRSGAVAKDSVRREDMILTIGWRSPKKNLNNVLEAMKILSQRGRARGHRLRIIGYDAGVNDIRRAIEALGITDMVELAGYVSDEELVESYTTAKAVVYIPIDEPFGLVPVEAMACGTPVVVSNHGGPGEIVEDGKTGIHVDPFDPYEVAGGIERLISDEELVNEMGENGYNLVRGKFTIDHYVERLLGEMNVS